MGATAADVDSIFGASVCDVDTLYASLWVLLTDTIFPLPFQ